MPSEAHTEVGAVPRSWREGDAEWARAYLTAGMQQWDEMPKSGIARR